MYKLLVLSFLLTFSTVAFSKGHYSSKSEVKAESPGCKSIKQAKVKKGGFKAESKRKYYFCLSCKGEELKEQEHLIDDVPVIGKKDKSLKDVDTLRSPHKYCAEKGKKEKYFYCDESSGKVKSVKARSESEAQKVAKDAKLHSKKKDAKAEVACGKSEKFFYCDASTSKVRSTKAKTKEAAETEAKTTVYESKKDAKNVLECTKADKFYYCDVNTGKVSTVKARDKEKAGGDLKVTLYEKKKDAKAIKECSRAGKKTNKCWVCDTVTNQVYSVKTEAGQSCEEYELVCDGKDGDCKPNSRHVYKKKREAKNDPLCGKQKPEVCTVDDSLKDLLTGELAGKAGLDKKQVKAAKKLCKDQGKGYKFSKKGGVCSCSSKPGKGDKPFCTVDDSLAEFLTGELDSATELDKKQSKTAKSACKAAGGKFSSKGKRGEKVCSCDKGTVTELACYFCAPGQTQAELIDVTNNKKGQKVYSKLSKKNGKCEDLKRSDVKKLLTRDTYLNLERYINGYSKKKYFKKDGVKGQGAKKPFTSVDQVRVFTDKAAAEQMANAPWCTPPSDVQVCNETYKEGSSEYENALKDLDAKVVACGGEDKFDFGICDCRPENKKSLTCSDPDFKKKVQSVTDPIHSKYKPQIDAQITGSSIEDIISQIDKKSNVFTNDFAGALINATNNEQLGTGISVKADKSEINILSGTNVCATYGMSSDQWKDINGSFPILITSTSVAATSLSLDIFEWKHPKIKELCKETVTSHMKSEFNASFSSIKVTADKTKISAGKVYVFVEIVNGKCKATKHQGFYTSSLKGEDSRWVDPGSGNVEFKGQTETFKKN